MVHFRQTFLIKQSLNSMNKVLNLHPRGFLSVIIIFYILRMVVPYANYIFIPLLIIFSLFSGYHIFKQYKSVNFIELLKPNAYLLLISVFFLWGFIISPDFIFPAFKELLNVIIFIFLAGNLFLLIKDKESFDEFTEILCKQFIFFSTIVSITGLIKFYIQIKNFHVSLLSDNEFRAGSSLTTDYNFFILFIFVGFIATLFGLYYFKRKSRVFTNNTALSLFLLLFSLTILFSFSRRGFIMLLLILASCVPIIYYSRKRDKKLYMVITRYFWSFILIVLLLLGFIFLTPAQNKRSTLKLIGIPVSNYRYFSYSLLGKYSIIFFNNAPDYLQKVLWKEKPDQKNPETGWGPIKCNIIYPLTGEKVEIVPDRSTGFKVDCSSEGSTWNNNTYFYSDISCLYKSESSDSSGNKYSASVYCYISRDFDGEWARISVEGDVSGGRYQDYDLKKAGTWQKLQIHFGSNSRTPRVLLYIAKKGVSNFSSLKGYVVFAYPEYKKSKVDPKDPDTGWGLNISSRVFPLTGKDVNIVPENSIGYKLDSTCDASTWNNNAYSYTNISSLIRYDSTRLKNKSFQASVYCYVSDDFDGSWVRISTENVVSGNSFQEYNLNRKGVWQKLQIYFTSATSVPPVYLIWSKNGVKDFKKLKGYIIYAYPEYLLITNRSEVSFKNINTKGAIYLSGISFHCGDIFKSFQSLVTPSFQDSINMVDNYLKDLYQNKLSGSRTTRYYYSWIIFKEYPLYNKLFGKGFDYMEQIAKKFGEEEYDYPHNPFISAFLYSGILGGLIYIWFILVVFFYYIKYFKYHIFYFLSFLVVFFFSFFSANTHFSVPIFTILSMIPFLTKNIVEKNALEIENINS
jgi:hypothetical protein